MEEALGRLSLQVFLLEVAQLYIRAPAWVLPDVSNRFKAGGAPPTLCATCPTALRQAALRPPWVDLWWTLCPGKLSGKRETHRETRRSSCATG
jgi:hypothetical protein